MKHHVSAGVGPSGPGDVVLPDEGTRVCGGWSTTSGTPPALWARETWCLWTKEQGFAGSEAPRPKRRSSAPPESDVGDPLRGDSSGPDSLFSRNERSRCTKCTAASFIYYAFFWTISSNRRSLLRWGSALPLVRRPLVRQRPAGPATPTPSGSAPQARQRPRRPAAPRRPGSAHAARQRPAGLATPTPPGSASQARQRLASPAAPRRPGSALVRSANSGEAHAARQRHRHSDEVCKSAKPAPPTPTSAAAGCAP